jgi:ArsR family transcriptional regulator
MDSELLTFHAPRNEQSRSVLALPSPTVELAYAYYAILRNGTVLELTWIKRLQLEQEDLLSQLRGFWQTEQPGKGFDLFQLVCDHGYARDPSPMRFLTDLEQRLKDFIARLEQQRQQLECQDTPDTLEKEKQMFLQLQTRLEQLLEPKLRKRFVGLLRQFWAWLEPVWESEGRNEATRASRVFQEKFEATQDVLAALPAHHFVQFESSAQTIRQAVERASIMVIPLFFASGGGFSFDFSGQHYIGYGIQTEDVHQRLFAQVAANANQMKALADPTRLMLLTLLVRYQHFEMSVSDFANQLGVTQPTISGHIKILREAGFVTLEKKGNKSLYQVNKTAIQASLEEVNLLAVGQK